MSDDFWDVAEPFLARPGVERSTMMGTACLRSGGEFVAMPDRQSGALIVKLSAGRVEDLIAAGVGASFAPAGRVFHEWVVVSAEDRWESLIGEAIEFATA